MSHHLQVNENVVQRGISASSVGVYLCIQYFFWHLNFFHFAHLADLKIFALSSLVEFLCWFRWVSLNRLHKSLQIFFNFFPNLLIISRSYCFWVQFSRPYLMKGGIRVFDVVILVLLEKSLFFRRFISAKCTGFPLCIY